MSMGLSSGVYSKTLFVSTSNQIINFLSVDGRRFTRLNSLTIENAGSTNCNIYFNGEVESSTLLPAGKMAVLENINLNNITIIESGASLILHGTYL